MNETELDRTAHPDHEQFIRDAEDNGWELRHYKGRSFWQGPAAEAEDLKALQEMLAATSVVCQWDDLGRGYILYPRAYAKGGAR